MAKNTHNRSRGLLIVASAGLVMTALRFWILPAAMPGLWSDPPMAAINLTLVSILLTILLGIVVSTTYHTSRMLATKYLKRDRQ